MSPLACTLGIYTWIALKPHLLKCTIGIKCNLTKTILSSNICKVGAAEILTATVFGHPADSGRKTTYVKMFAIKLRALLLSEVSLVPWTRLSVTGAEFHAASNAKAPAIPWPITHEHTNTHMRSSYKCDKILVKSKQA